MGGKDAQGAPAYHVQAERLLWLLLPTNSNIVYRTANPSPHSIARKPPHLGLVVQSTGRNCRMAPISPVSATTLLICRSASSWLAACVCFSKRMNDETWP